MSKYKILLVEDDVNFGSVMKSYLELNSFEVDWVNDGKNAVETFKSNNYNLCVLDVMLPHIDGFTIGTQIKQISAETPIVFLTAKTMKEDMIKGFSIGADDYITKPFDSEVLIYKIKAILKRTPDNTITYSDNTPLAIGIFNYNYSKRELTADGIETKKLSPKESELLKQLIINKNKVLDRDFALENIWGEKGYFTARSMDVYITKLRKYLKPDNGLEIVNIHGSGYILKENI